MQNSSIRRNTDNLSHLELLHPKQIPGYISPMFL